MKKFIAFLFVCGFAVAVVSCGQKSETSEGSADTATVVEPAPVVADTTAADTTAISADTTVAK
jgi:hypothetical protein